MKMYTKRHLPTISHKSILGNQKKLLSPLKKIIIEALTVKVETQHPISKASDLANLFQ